MLTAHDCNTLVRSFGAVRLLAASDNAGPYAIRVGSVIVGAFGFDRSGESSDFVDESAHQQQLTAFHIAKVAFHAIEEAVIDGGVSDPAAIRKIGRRACSASRKLWSVLGYGSTPVIRKSHEDLVLKEAHKAALAV